MTQRHGPQPKGRITKINGKPVPYPDEIELTEDQALELFDAYQGDEEDEEDEIERRRRLS